MCSDAVEIYGQERYSLCKEYVWNEFYKHVWKHWFISV